MHLLSFDLEEWFHVFTRYSFSHPEKWHRLPVMLPAITDKILQLLSENDTQATFFCLGWVASRYPELVRKIHGQGHEIAAHSCWHKRVHKQTYSAFREDLRRNVEELEALTGKKVISYRAPSFTRWQGDGFGCDALLEAGIRVDSSVKSGCMLQNIRVPNHPFRLTNNDNGLIFYPISAVSFLYLQFPYAGSGYFRLLPFTYIQHKLNQPGYHMLYFHPRDLDPLVSTRKEFSLHERLRFFPGTKKAMSRLEALLKCYFMTSIQESLQQINIEPFN